MTNADIIRTANASLGRNRARSVLTVIAIFIGALTLSLTSAMGEGIRSYLEGQLGNLGAEQTLIISARTEGMLEKEDPDAPDEYNPDRKRTAAQVGQGPGGVTLLGQKDLELLEAREELMNVRAGTPPSVDFVQLVGGDKKFVVGVAGGGRINIDLVAGRAVDKDSAAEATIPKAYATAFGFTNPADAVGKRIALQISDTAGVSKTFEAEVVGVQEKSLIGSAAVFISPSLMSDAYDYQNRLVPLAAKQQYPVLFAEFPADLDASGLERLQDSLKEAGYNSTTAKQQSQLVFDAVNSVIIVLNAFGIIALLAASLGIVNTLLMSVQERTKEIGLMKALGLGRHKIFALFSLEAVLLGFWGSLLGILVAIGIGQVANRVSEQTFLKSIEGLQLLSFPVLNQVVIVVAIMAVAFIAGTLPAARASKKDPIEALRYE